ncbi:MAG: DUF2341 domain-containing protein [Proteobacteria bacterium]|nr:DUF2341 domain-containing protein [Pseudomonadota bacterium]
MRENWTIGMAGLVIMAAAMAGCGGTGHGAPCGNGYCGVGYQCLEISAQEWVCRACGDGVFDARAGEQCDDGNTEDGDGCSADCQSIEICGNGVVDVATGEECDHSGESQLCNDDCTTARCGDRKHNSMAGETCDDGNQISGDGCSADCRNELCGNGTVDVNEGEECDDAGESQLCDDDCTAVRCGDGNFNAVAGEVCDDGNQISGDGCSAECDRAAGVAVGGNYTCAVADDGGVRCWGHNEYGQLGASHTDRIGDDELPNSAGAADVGGPVGQIVTASTHTCGLLDGGAVRCWGYNRHGQLGYGHTDYLPGSPRTMPPDDVELIEPDSSETVVQLATGWGHTCARMDTGAVRCWGSNGNGQLGSGNTDHIGDNQGEMPPGDVNVGASVIDISAGRLHTCALVDTGMVRCWGWNSDGQLGHGTTDEAIGDEPGEMPPADVDVGGPVAAITAGGWHTCALLQTGAVRCWGSNRYGQLGHGTTDTIGDEPGEMPPADIDVGGSVLQLAAGEHHTCALLATGAVRCWGYNEFGQLGYGMTETVADQPGEMPPADIEIGGPAIYIAARGAHTCAVMATGAIRCWGDNTYGQLGYGHSLHIGNNENPSVAGDVPYLPIGCWLDSWSGVTSITVHNAKHARTDYAVRVIVDTESPIDEGKMNSDCSDIRFSDAASNPLSYWLESGCNTTHTRLWVKVVDLPAGISELYMQYGNSAAPTASSGVATFPYFEDFASGDLASWTSGVNRFDPGHDSGHSETLDPGEYTSPGYSVSLYSYSSCGRDPFNGVQPYVETTVNLPGAHHCLEFDSRSDILGFDYSTIARIDNWVRLDGDPVATTRVDCSGFRCTASTGWLSRSGELPLGQGTATLRLESYTHDCTEGQTWFDNVRIRPCSLPEPLVAIGVSYPCQ